MYKCPPAQQFGNHLELKAVCCWIMCGASAVEEGEQWDHRTSRPPPFQVDIRYLSATEARGPRQAVELLNENCKWKRTNQRGRTVPHYCALSASSLSLKSCEDLFLSSHVAAHTRTHTHTHTSEYGVPATGQPREQKEEEQAVLPAWQLCR